MPKLKLQPNPTFEAPVSIPVPGGDDETVRFVFKWRSRPDFQEFTKGLEGRPFDAIVMDMASGWDLEESFNAENVKALCDNYMGAGVSVLDTYTRELAKAKEKN